MLLLEVTGFVFELKALNPKIKGVLKDHTVYRHGNLHCQGSGHNFFTNI